MPVPVPSPSAPINGTEWQRFFMDLGQPTYDLQWYPGLKLLADANGIALPSPSEPIARDGTISTVWYPVLQRLAGVI